MSTILKLAIKGSETPPRPGLKEDILTALKSIDNKTEVDQNVSREEFAEDLAEAIAQRVAIAVQDYLRTNVQVQTQVVVSPGITVATTGTPAAQAGATTSPGTGTGTGTLIVIDPPAVSSPRSNV